MFRHMTVVAAVALLASGVSAQNHQQGSHNPAIKDSSPHAVPMPAHGANSFTQDQARGRMMKAGYTRISALKKDGNGVWRGMAYRGHTRVRVGVDYKGNVTR